MYSVSDCKGVAFLTRMCVKYTRGVSLKHVINNPVLCEVF